MQSANVTNLQPSALSFSMKTQNLPIPGGISVSVAPFNIDMYVPANVRSKNDLNPYITAAIPELHLKGKGPLSIVNQTVNIANETELVSVFRSAALGSAFNITAFGKITAKVAGLKIPLTLNKTLSFPGERRWRDRRGFD